MNSTNLLRLSGISAILAGIAYILDTIFDFAFPDNMLGIGIFVSLFGLYGLAGLFVRQRAEGGWLNLIGYVLNSMGLAALIGVVFTNNFVVSALEKDVVEDLFSGSLLIAFISVGVIYLLGVLVFGMALWRGGVFSKSAIVLYIMGSIPVALPPVFPEAVVSLGGIMVALGIMWLGVQLWQDKSTTGQLAY